MTTMQQGFENSVKGNPTESVFAMEDGRIILHYKGKLFPKDGGLENGEWYGRQDLTSHIEDIVSRILKATA